MYCYFSKIMTKSFLFSFVIVLIGCQSTFANKWCNMRCYSYAPHVYCRFKPNVISPACGKVIKAGLTYDERFRIVDLHNSLRQKVASGQEKRGISGPQPPAREMPNLFWDDELEEIAQTWANQCNYGHACSYVDRFAVGQNIAYDYNSSVEKIITNWYNEVDNYNRNEIAHFDMYRPGSKPKIGHYTQIVWAETTKIGCGAVRYINPGKTMEQLYLVCNYGPAGNVGGFPVYKTA